MKVRLYVSKVEALKAGKDRHGCIVVEVPAESLTPEQREELAQHDYSSQNEPKADFFLDKYEQFSKCPIAEATPENAVRILDALIANRKAEIEKQKAEAAEKAAKHEAAVKAWLDAPVENLVYHVYGIEYRMVRRIDGHECPKDDRLAEKLAAAQALIEIRTAEKQAEIAAANAESVRKSAEAKARQDAGREVLRQWAVANGSELLRARIDGGFTWEGLAQQEFGRSVIDSLELPYEEVPNAPEGYDGSPDVEKRTTPTLEEIQALRFVRERGKGKPVAVELKWMKYDPERDDEDYYDDREPIARTELEITVTCPDDAKHTYFFLPSEAKVSAD